MWRERIDEGVYEDRILIDGENHIPATRPDGLAKCGSQRLWLERGGSKNVPLTRFIFYPHGWKREVRPGRGCTCESMRHMSPQGSVTPDGMVFDLGCPAGTLVHMIGCLHNRENPPSLHSKPISPSVRSNASKTSPLPR